MTTVHAALPSLKTRLAIPPVSRATPTGDGHSIWVFSRDHASVMLLRQWFGDGSPNNLESAISRWLTRPMTFFAVMLDHGGEEVSWYGAIADTDTLHETLSTLLEGAPGATHVSFRPIVTDPERARGLLEFWETLPRIAN